MRTRNWKLAASCHEVITHINASQQYRDGSMMEFAKARMNADLARAISILPENKVRALQTLKTIHQDFMPDGVLADDFYPALREAGLQKELEAWFAESWELMVGVIEKYPKSHNTRNTAAWFASRAGMKLAEAEKYQIEAINMSPEQAAYLDTMAELKFAQGNRKAALEWSERSVGFAPFEDMIRAQYERFRTAPLPQN
jgi:tetratricopeptide (TPR) repeat protein